MKREGKLAQTVGAALVAEDHGVTRFGLLQFLRDRLGVGQTYEAQRFSEALDMLSRHPIDLAVIDLVIPGLESPRDLAQIRKRFPGVRVVVLTGSSLRSNILAALEAGVHGYIVKTDSMDDLAERLGYVMKGEIYVPPCLAEMGADPGSAAATAESVNGAGLPKLTQRQQQVLRSIVRGQSNKQIAKELKLAVGTVKMHVSSVLTALGAQNRSHAAALGRRLFE